MAPSSKAGPVARLRRRGPSDIELGGPDYADSSGELPPKPKGMHWRTYEREIAQIETFENACNFYLLQCIARL